jgi:YesN/AraC family two-component response regulator
MKCPFSDNNRAFFFILFVFIYPFPVTVTAENMNTAAPFMLNESVTAKNTDSILSNKVEKKDSSGFSSVVQQKKEVKSSGIGTPHKITNPVPDKSLFAKIFYAKRVDNSTALTKKIMIRISIALLLICLIICFILFAKSRKDKTAFVTRTRLSIMDKEVQLACGYIEKNYKNQDLSTDIICKNLITGRPFLEALFKQELGVDIELFINHVRINRAIMLLKQKHEIKSDIAAFETGFSNAETFCTAFNKITGVKFEKYLDARTKT